MLVSVTVTVPPWMYIPPPCQTRKVLAFGQFREVSSCGGVGRKCREGSKRPARTDCKSHQGRYDVEVGIDHQRSVQGNFFRRGRRKKVQGMFQRQAHTLPCGIIEKGANRSSGVSSGKFLPAGASEESARKVQKANTYPISCVVIDVGVRYCHCTS